MNKLYILFLANCLIFYSCSTININGRNNKDIELNQYNYEHLNGTFSNSIIDSSQLRRTLIGNFKYDTTFANSNYKVRLNSIDNRTIELKLLFKDSLITNYLVEGKYKNGYFKVRRQWKTNFIAGPLLWILGDDLKYIGITKENNLIIINSGGGGIMFLIAIPIFAASGGQFENQYLRKD
ncbi:MAG: hypothetical protein ACXWW0_05915 [Bacteroidia bacterium]